MTVTDALHPEIAEAISLMPFEHMSADVLATMRSFSVPVPPAEGAERRDLAADEDTAVGLHRRRPAHLAQDRGAGPLAGQMVQHLGAAGEARLAGRHLDPVGQHRLHPARGGSLTGAQRLDVGLRGETSISHGHGTLLAMIPHCRKEYCYAGTIVLPPRPCQRIPAD